MNKEVEEILNIIIELLCVCKNLSRLESEDDGVNYSEVTTDLKWNLMVLRNRLADLTLAEIDQE